VHGRARRVTTDGMRALAILVTLAAATAAPGRAAADDTAAADPDDPEAWLASLTDKVIVDLAGGLPLVVQIHAPLCEKTIIPCGNDRLGNGDNPDTNLYWATSPGFGKWFARKGGGWKKVLDQKAGDTGDADVLAVHVYKRTMTAPKAWVAKGAPAKFSLFAVVHGWRGSAIDRSLEAYARELSGLDPRVLALADGTELVAGGSAQIVAFSGHNRLMDIDEFQWPEPAKTAKGAIAVACKTADYMQEAVPAPTRVPLLMTRDFLFANAAPVEAVVLAFARGGSYSKMRKDAAAAYAGVQKRPAARVLYAFTNPGHDKWRRAKSSK
jgi:hypothetical protein